MTDVVTHSLSGEICRTSNGKLIIWNGHLCEGANLTSPIGRDFCLWTICGKFDVPANKAHEGNFSEIECTTCKEKQMTDIIQGSESWFQHRAGKLTASRMSDVTARTKTGFGAGRKNYMAQLLVERLTGIVAESYTNAAMQHGIDTEPEARAAYEFYQGVEVKEVGFIDHPTIPMTGASPDGIIGIDGMLEIKCPNSATHIDTLLKGTIPSKYVKQMQWQMACADRNWCDFVSYDPRMPEEMKLFVSRVEYDPSIGLEEQAIEFLKELADQVLQLQSKYQPDAEPNILLGG